MALAKSRPFWGLFCLANPRLFQGAEAVPLVPLLGQEER